MNRLSNVKSWVFDLDNTLYNAETCIFRQFGKKETVLLERLHTRTGEDIEAIKRNYMSRYGSIMLGLQSDGLLHPREFLEFVHDVDLSNILPCEKTIEGVSNLRGRKIIFTNGPRFFAEAVLDKLKIFSLFDGLYTIEDADYAPKPATATYADFIKKQSIVPEDSCMIEDSSTNLKPAHALGMTTVWVHRKDTLPDVPQHVHYAATDLVDWFRSL